MSTVEMAKKAAERQVELKKLADEAAKLLAKMNRLLGKVAN